MSDTHRRPEPNEGESRNSSFVQANDNARIVHGMLRYDAECAALLRDVRQGHIQTGVRNGCLYVLLGGEGIAPIPLAKLSPEVPRSVEEIYALAKAELKRVLAEGTTPEFRRMLTEVSQTEAHLVDAEGNDVMTPVQHGTLDKNEDPTNEQLTLDFVERCNLTLADVQTKCLWFASWKSLLQSHSGNAAQALREWQQSMGEATLRALKELVGTQAVLAWWVRRDGERASRLEMILRRNETNPENSFFEDRALMGRKSLQDLLRAGLEPGITPLVRVEQHLSEGMERLELHDASGARMYHKITCLTDGTVDMDAFSRDEFLEELRSIVAKHGKMDIQLTPGYEDENDGANWWKNAGGEAGQETDYHIQLNSWDLHFFVPKKPAVTESHAKILNEVPTTYRLSERTDELRMALQNEPGMEELYVEEDPPPSSAAWVCTYPLEVDLANNTICASRLFKLLLELRKLRKQRRRLYVHVTSEKVSGENTEAYGAHLYTEDL